MQPSGLCEHVCLAETPYIAAGIAEARCILAGIEPTYVVLEVAVGGLDLFFELGEARHHGAPIEPERLTVLDWRPAPVSTA